MTRGSSGFDPPRGTLGIKNWRGLLLALAAYVVTSVEVAGKRGGLVVETLIIGFCILAGIWIVVLWGARYFGPRDA
jgi:hypothetical protein